MGKWSEQGFVPYNEHIEEVAKAEQKAWKHYEAELNRLRQENHSLIDRLKIALDNGLITWEQYTDGKF